MKLAKKLFKESCESKLRLLKEAEEFNKKETKDIEPKIIAWIEKNLSDKFTEATKDGLLQIEATIKKDSDNFFELYVYDYLINQGFFIKEVITSSAFNRFFIISWDNLLKSC
jgi:hypothetical protein